MIITYLPVCMYFVLVWGEVPSAHSTKLILFFLWISTELFLSIVGTIV